MGIGRLWSFIKQHKDEIVEQVDLVEVAKGYPGGLRILVDFFSWEHYVKDKFWKTLTLVTENQFLMFDGGEYDLIDSYIKSLIAALRCVNIEVVFYLDGAKGSSYHATKQKMKTWRKRHFEDQKQLAQCFRFLRGEIPLDQVRNDHLVRPCLQEVQNILTLQEAGCVIHQRISGEADSLIAQHMRDDERAFCIFSNDTDFCVFPGSSYMSHEFFDMGDDLGLGLLSLSAKTPDKLVCGIISSANLARFLKLPCEEALIEMAILGGNDFTSPYLPQCIPGFSRYCGQFELLAQMVTQFQQAEMCPEFGQAISANRGLREAVEHSRKFYTLTLEDEEEHQTGFVFSVIAEGVRQLKYPSTIVAMHRGFYWRRQVLEDPTPGLPTAEGAYSTLRSFVYALLLPPFKQVTTEYGRTPGQVLEEVQVPKPPGMPSLAGVKKNSFPRNMALFERVMSHLEYQPPAEGRTFFKLYGMRKGFLCHLLRYFLLLNWGQNLFLSDREFYVVAAWLLGNHNHEWYRNVKIVPSPRCVTVESWFLALYRTAYAFLGSVLGLCHEFPPPRDLFSGATWVVLYTGHVVNDPNPDFREPMPLSVTMQEMVEASAVVGEVVKDNRHVLNNVVNGVLPPNFRSY